MSEYGYDPLLPTLVPLAATLPTSLIAQAAGTVDSGLTHSGGLHFYLMQPSLKAMRTARQLGDVSAYENHRKDVVKMTGVATVADLLASADEMEGMLQRGLTKHSPAYKAVAKKPVVALSTLLAIDWLTKALRPTNTGPRRGPLPEL